MGDNSGFSEEQLEIIRDQTKAITVLEDRRDAINADINSARKKIKAAGCNLDAWRAQKRRAEMDPEKREAFDASAIAAASALGVPLQGNLFEGEKPDGGMPGANDGPTQH